MIRVNVVGFIDRRSLDLHRAHDVIEARRFALRVTRAKERVRLAGEARRLPVLLRPQAG